MTSATALATPHPDPDLSDREVAMRLEDLAHARSERAAWLRSTTDGRTGAVEPLRRAVLGRACELDLAAAALRSVADGYRTAAA